ncbi:MAG TPA: hypothetical protein VEP71_04910 [Gallionella sp.]|nr:hypothetical protein [Gallionella sp.]
MMHNFFRTIHTLTMALLSVAANAEELSDPTRPPPGFTLPAVSPASGTAANQSAGLQSIIISKNRRAAIIDGETVELGDKYGGAKLIEVNEGSVVLRSAQGRQVMTLFPSVRITGKQETNKIEPQLPAGGVQSGKQKNRPTAHKEKE